MKNLALILSMLFTLTPNWAFGDAVKKLNCFARVFDAGLLPGGFEQNAEGKLILKIKDRDANRMAFQGPVDFSVEKVEGVCHYFAADNLANPQTVLELWPGKTFQMDKYAKLEASIAKLNGEVVNVQMLNCYIPAEFKLELDQQCK